MHKIFFDNRFFAISSDYQSCSASHSSVVCILHSIDNIPFILNEFIANKNLKILYLCTNSIDEDKAFEAICSNLTKITAAGGLVRNTKNEVLMIYRFNHWDLPKGWHENSETIEQTAIREVEEECGLSGLTLGSFITKTYHIYMQNEKKIVKETYWFEIFYDKDEQLIPQKEEDIEDAKWIAVESLKPFVEKAYTSIKEVFLSSKIIVE